MNYELSDNPHPVGTPEHHRWIVDVYIPSLDDEAKEQHRKRAGAEAIGKQLIDGRYACSGTMSGPYSVTFGGVDLSQYVKDIKVQPWQRSVFDEWFYWADPANGQPLIWRGSGTSWIDEVLKDNQS